jgi:GntR family transcriptional regulator
MDSVRLQITIDPSSGVPIFRQVVEQFTALAAGGRLRAGDMLPSVRQLATDLQINPMTVSKAYTLLEAAGVVERVRGTGMRITEEAAGATVRQRQTQFREVLEPVIERARQLHLTDEQVLAVVKAALRESHHEPAHP